MSDNLRDRIAAVMHDHLLHRGFHVECACGWVSQEPGRTTVDHDAHVAAVIEALGLTRVTRSERVPRHRYVTDWITND